MDAAARAGQDRDMDFDREVAELEQVWRTHVRGDPRVQLASWREREPNVEVRMSVPTPATQVVLLAVCERYGLQLYKRPRQHRSSVCVQAPERFMDEVLHPLLEDMAQIVEEAALRTTEQIIKGWSERRE